MKLIKTLAPILLATLTAACSGSSKSAGHPDAGDGGGQPDGRVDGGVPDGSNGGDGGGTTTTFEWTEFTPSADTQIIYLSTSDGNDQNDCLSETAACRTLQHGESLLRDGYPDWLLLKRGDEWEESFSDGWNFSWTKSGRSETEPMLVSNYGTGPRPLIKAGQEHGFHRFRDNDVHDVALVGIHFKAHTRDPYSGEYQGPALREFQSGFRWTGGGNVDRILIENCKFEFFGSNFAMHPSGNGQPFRSIRVRGNVFYSAWTGSSAQYSQGIYTDGINGLLIEGNVFDRNGGLVGFTNDPNGIVPAGLSAEDVTVTWYNHQAYIQSNNLAVTVLSNIFANGDGMQLRPGGIAEDNLFTRCINSMNFGPATTPVSGGVFGRIANNVFLQGTDFAPESATPGVRANGIHIANLHPTNGLTVAGNIFARDMSEDRYGRAIDASGQDCGSGNAYPCPVHNLTIENNIVYNWRGGFQFSGTLGSQMGDITVIGNLLQNGLDDGARLLNLSDGFDAAEFSFGGGVYHRGGDANWFRVSGNGIDFAGWVSLTGEAGAAAEAVQFADPDRTLGDYNALQGGDATHEAFMQRAREQCRNNWDPAYEAVNVNQYIREGFALSDP